MKRQKMFLPRLSALLLAVLVGLMPLAAFAEEAAGETESIVNSPNEEAVPAEQYPSGSWVKYEPCNELNISCEELNNDVLAAKMTGNHPFIIWSKGALNDDEKSAVLESLKNVPGVGNPKDVLYLEGDGASEYGMHVNFDSENVSFDRSKNWALIYRGSGVKGTPVIGESEQGEEELPENDPVIGEEPEQGEENLPEDDPVIDEEPEPAEEEIPEEEHTMEEESDLSEEEEPDDVPDLEDIPDFDGIPEPVPAPEEGEDNFVPAPDENEGILDPAPEEKLIPEEAPVPVPENRPEVDIAPEAPPAVGGLPDRMQPINRTESDNQGTVAYVGILAPGDQPAQIADLPIDSPVEKAPERLLDVQPQTGLPGSLYLWSIISAVALICLLVSAVYLLRVVNEEEHERQ